ncbi:MAG: hypothetical protein ACLQU2_34495, partial [Candidatus Binataceae bacterium]
MLLTGLTTSPTTGSGSDESNPGPLETQAVVDDFVITTGGVDVVSRTKFKEWAAAFMAKINDLQFEVIETFQNEDG